MMQISSIMASFSCVHNFKCFLEQHFFCLQFVLPFGKFHLILYIIKLHSISPRLTQIFQNIFKELIQIDIEIKKRIRLKELFHKIHGRSEDLLFCIFQKLPEKFIPAFLMDWTEHYTNKRIAELKQQIIRDRWHTIELEKAVDNIHDKQQDKNKAPSED